MSSQRDYFYPNTEPLAADEMRITALGTGRAVRAPRAGQLLVADRAGQRRQVRDGFRLGLAGELHRAGNSASGHHRLFRHPSARRPRRRFRAGVDRKLGRRPGQAAGAVRAFRSRSRNTAPSISCESRWSRWSGTPRRGSDCCRTPAPRSRSTSSISPRPAWSMTTTASSSKAFRRSTSTTARSAIGWSGTGFASCSPAIPRRASSSSTTRRAPTS